MFALCLLSSVDDWLEKAFHRVRVLCNLVPTNAHLHTHTHAQLHTQAHSAWYMFEKKRWISASLDLLVLWISWIKRLVTINFWTYSRHWIFCHLAANPFTFRLDYCGALASVLCLWIYATSFHVVSARTDRFRDMFTPSPQCISFKFDFPIQFDLAHQFHLFLFATFVWVLMQIWLLFFFLYFSFCLTFKMNAISLYTHTHVLPTPSPKHASTTPHHLNTVLTPELIMFNQFWFSITCFFVRFQR